MIEIPGMDPQIKIPNTFREALIRAYQKDPCNVLPNALWKTIQTLGDYETSFTFEESQIKQLKIFNEKQLMLLWNRDDSLVAISDENINKFDFALLHQNQIENLATTHFDITPYFRLIHHHDNILPVKSIPGFTIKNADPINETEKVAKLINQSYPNMHHKPKGIMEWTQHPVFLPELWIWIFDQRSKKPAALGIAEHDANIREGSLEWIQVLPEYRGLGLGRMLCNELIKRLEKKADFTTVSGQVYNDTHPDILYRKVGFQGNDIWWVLRKKKGKK